MGIEYRYPLALRYLAERLTAPVSAGPVPADAPPVF
jgi:hypothetical protein